MVEKKRRNLFTIIIPTILLFSIWLLFSGKFELKFILIGLFSSVFISFMCYPFLFVKNNKSGREYFIFDINIFKFVFYCLWLLKEIIKSSIDVSKEVFKPNLNYEPRVVYFSMPYENPMARVVLSHSIILTPGTITIDVVENGVFEVHALDRNFADGLLDGTMQLKVAQLFNETCEYKALDPLEIVRKGVK